jgi:hypothetical protein
MAKISITTTRIGRTTAVAQPVRRRHELADAGAGEGKADGNFQVAQ